MFDLYKGETKRPINFTPKVDVNGQVVTITAYDEDGTPYVLGSDGVTNLAGAKDVQTEAFIKSPSDMPTGIFNVKIATAEVLISKDRMRHWGDDPYDLQ